MNNNEKMTEIEINGTGDLQRAAQEFLKRKGDNNIISFYKNICLNRYCFLIKVL